MDRINKMIFETHAHYDDDAFDEDREALLAQLPENGIGYVVNIGASLLSVKSSIALAEKYEYIYASAGIHPSDTDQLNEENLAWLKQQCSHPKVVAVGEIGLDYHYEDPERKIQKEWFARQLDLAREVKKPIIIHSREAAQDTYEIMKAHKAQENKGVIHCFSYTRETAKQYLDWNYYFGIGGVVTFKNAKKLKEAVEYIPIENILLETDCPYMAPTPHRGERNSSLYLPLVAEAIGEIKGISTEEVISITEKNAKNFYGIV